MATAIASLARLLEGDADQRARNAETVLFLILAAFLRKQNAAEATALAQEWTIRHVQAEGQATRQEMLTTGQAILDRFSVSETFTDEVSGLHPWRREEAVAIRGSWPTIETVVHALMTAGDRAGLLRQWSEQPPSWFTDAPADIAWWLGELAAEHGERIAATRFLGYALERGAFPAGYWTARRAIYLFEDDPDEAERVLESAPDPHPLATCLLAWHREAFQDGLEALSAWTTSNAKDSALKAHIQAKLMVGTGDLNGGIALALEAAEDEHASGVAIFAAELLLSRGRHGPTIHRLADAEQAAALAIQARNARRAWQGDSVAAVLVAVKAAWLGGNHTRAWALMQTPPDGEATEAEADDPRLRREAARLAALTGRFDEARAAAEGSNSPFIEREIAASELTAHGRIPDAIAAWQAALAVADDDEGMLVAAMSLAELGVPVPDLGDLEQSHSEVVREIRIVQQAMSAGGDRLEALRRGASESLILTIKLAELHADRDEPRMAADVLKAGAERWDQPRMMLMSARHYIDAGDLEEARSAVESALTLGGTRWAGEFDGRALLLQIHDATGDWEQATQQARALVALDPRSPDARWALVHCLIRRGEHEAAWNALTLAGDPIPPRHQQDAIAWIGLAARYDTSTQFVQRALRTMRRWPDDAQVTGVFIGQLYTGLRREELTPAPEDLEALHAATAEYVERFPDSSVFRSVAVPEHNPLAPMLQELRERHESLANVAALVRDGRLPLGVLADATGHSYTEASLKRAAGFVRCHDPARETETIAAAAAALGHAVVLDVTAAHALALLDPDTRSRLLAGFSQVLATDPTYRDVLRGHEFLGMRSTMSVGWNPVADEPSVSTIEESAAEELAELAERMAEILRDAVRRPWPDIRTLEAPDNAPRDSAWLTSLDMAATDGGSLWCDDWVLRAFATSLGVATFSTVDLLRQFAASKRLGSDVVTVCEATLLRNYFTDLGFSRAMFDFAAILDDWSPRGAAFAIGRPATWMDPAAVMEFVLFAASQCADSALDDLEGWITAAALGLVRIAPDEDAASANLRILLSQCMTQPWMGPDRFPAVLRAIRIALDERPDTSDPVPPVVAETYRGLVGQHGHGLAQMLLMSLVQFAPQQDQFTAARVVLTHQD